MIISPDLVPLLRTNLGLVRGTLWRRLAWRRLPWTPCLCRSLESFKTEILHASLLLVVVAHAERVSVRTLGLELELGGLRDCHLVIGECGGSRVANTRSVAAILVYIELLLHGVVCPSVVCGEEIGSNLIDGLGIRVGRGSVEALIACVALPLVGMRVVRVQLGVGRVASSISHAKLALVRSCTVLFKREGLVRVGERARLKCWT
jgi:hypothetical protein